MSLLRERLSATRRGSGGISTLIGAAGIGKTRCMQELAALARAEGFTVWSGRSTEDTIAPVFWPWMQVLTELARDRPALRDTSHALLTRLGSVEPSVDEQKSQDTTPAGSFWFFDGVNALLRAAALKGPILLLLDDLHWADAGSMHLLAFVAPELAQQSVLILSAQRDGNGTRRTRELRRLARHADRVELEPLTANDIGQYLGAVARTSEPRAALSEALHRVTAGNPLFLSQAVRELIARHGQQALCSLAPELIRPVTSARDVLGSAFDGLDARTRRVLEIASVLGEEFEVSTLKGLCQLEASTLLATLEAAGQEGFVLSDLPNRFRFRHALLRSALYDALAAADRMSIHRRAAEALEQSATPWRYGEIAHHYYRSLALGEYARVATSAEQAARRRWPRPPSPLRRMLVTEAQTSVPSARM
jgi:predicted ATPase